MTAPVLGSVLVTLAWVVLVLFAIMILAVGMLVRVAQRRGWLRRARLTAQEQFVSIGPQRRLAHSRLALDDAVRNATRSVEALGVGGADVDALHLLTAQLGATSARLAQRLDALAGLDDAALERVLELAEQSVNQVVSIADQVVTASGVALAGSTGLEVGELTQTAGDSLAAVGQRLDAMRELG